MGIELEQKYVVDGPRPWTVQAELLALLRRAGYEVDFLEEKPQLDTYYDTACDTLLERGGSLRVRRRGERRILTVKAPIGGGTAGTFQRREEELELSPKADPAGFLRRALPGVDLGELRPVAEVENLRRTYEVAGPAGCRFELAFDDVIFRAQGRETRERQVEIEQLHGTAEDLARLVGESAGRLPALRPVTDSKYQRARRLTRAER